MKRAERTELTVSKILRAALEEFFCPAGQKSLRHSSRAGVRNRFLGVYDQISR